MEVPVRDYGGQRRMNRCRRGGAATVARVAQAQRAEFPRAEALTAEIDRAPRVRRRRRPHPGGPRAAVAAAVGELAARRRSRGSRPEASPEPAPPGRRRTNPTDRVKFGRRAHRPWCCLWLHVVPLRPRSRQRSSHCRASCRPKLGRRSTLSWARAATRAPPCRRSRTSYVILQADREAAARTDGNPALPDLPTIADTLPRLPDHAVTGHRCAGRHPRDIVKRLAEEFDEPLTNAEVRTTTS